MTHKDSQSDTELWREAIEICESLMDMERSDALAKLKSMDLSPELLEKINRILNNMSSSNPLLDQHDYESLICNLKEGNHLIGEVIDGYKIIKLVGKGGMSTVYEAKHVDEDPQQSVAIKLLSPYGITEKAIELFNREQYILSKLSHPSIVAFHHSGVTADGKHYLVMELLENAQNIDDYCANNDYSKRQIAELVKQLCGVFAYAHDQQVIHRDIKPANILMTEGGRPNVIDFGIGRLDVLDGQTITRVFTPDMAAPEQLLGKSVNSKTDVFTLGALLMQLLTKKKPLPKANIKSYHPENDLKHIQLILKGSNLDKDLKNIITTAMHLDSELRYQSMEAFAEDLDNWLNGKPVNASADSLFYRAKNVYRKNKTFSILSVIAFICVLVFTWVISNLENQKHKADSQRDSTYALLEAMIDQADPVNSEVGSEVDSDALVKSLNALALSQQQLLSEDAALSAFFYKKLSELYNSKGLYNEALLNIQKAIAAFKLFTDENDERLISAQVTSAHLLESTGQLDEAQVLGELMHEKIERLPNIDPKYRLNNYYLLSKVHQYQGRNEIALDYGQKALKWIELNPEVSEPLQASIFNSLAVVNRHLGNMQEAEALYIKAIELLRPIREKHKDLSTILVNFAIFKGRSGDMEASEANFQESFALLKSLEPNHPHLGINYLPYTTLLHLTGRTDEAAEYTLKAIDIFKKSSLRKHLGEAYVRYARIGLYQFNPTLTFEYLIKAYPIILDTFGADHFKTYDVYNMALWVFMVGPSIPEALELIERVDDLPNGKSVGTRELKWYELQKAYILGQSHDSELTESVFVNYRSQISKLDQNEKNHWFQQQLNNSDKHSKLTVSWLQLQLAIINNDVEAIETLCDPQLKWASDSKLVFKMMIVDSCLLKQQYLSQDDIATFNKWHIRSKNDQKDQTALINQFLQLVKNTKASFLNK